MVSNGRHVLLARTAVGCAISLLAGCYSRSPLDYEPVAAESAVVTTAGPALANLEMQKSDALRFTLGEPEDEEGQRAARALDPQLASEVRATPHGGRTELEIRTPAEWGKPNLRKLRLVRDATIAPTDAVRIKVVAEMPGSAIVIIDEYSSAPATSCMADARANAPTAGIGARTCEAFLRVISVAGTSTRETLRRKITTRSATAPSGLDDMRGLGLEWDARASTLRIAMKPTAATPLEKVAFRIRGDGTVDDRPSL